MFEDNRIVSHRVGVRSIDYFLYIEQARVLRSILDRHFNMVLDYGAGNSPYRDLVSCNNFFSADVTQNKTCTIDYIIQSDSKIKDIEDGAFDLILCMDVLEHIAKDDVAVAELNRMTRQEGYLIATVPFIYREHEFPHDFRRYTSIGIRQLLSVAGYTDIQVYKIGNVWQVLFAIWFKSRILNGEVDGRNLIQKITRKIASYIFIPLANATIFRIPVENNSGIYSRLIVIAKK